MTIEIVVPQVGEAVSEVILVEWFKEEGETVKKGEPLFEVDTDKAVVEVEAFADGTLVQILVPGNSPVMPRQVVGLLAAAGESVEPASSGAGDETADDQARRPNKVSPLARRMAAELAVDVDGAFSNDQDRRITAEDIRREAARQARPQRASPDGRRAGRVPASPKARRLARELGVEVSGLTGTGVDGLITATDVQRAARATTAETAPPAPAPVEVQPGTQPFSKLRRTIAGRMQASKQTVPHFYLMADVDMSQVQQLRRHCQQTLGWEHPPTYTDVVVRACALALAALPRLNIFYTDDGIGQRRTVDIGLAVSVEDGLIVPVLPRADRLTLRQTSAQLGELSRRARQGRLRPSDLSAKSMVVSNLGMYGVDAFVAIIDMPDPMILAVGQVADRAVPVEGQLAIRPICTLTLSADHRVLDGVLGAQFLTRVKAILENPFEVMGG